MEKTEFMERVRKKISTRLGGDFTVVLKQVEKNNGVRLNGLIIRSAGYNIAPTIYLESFWEAYRQGIGFADIISQILGIYREDMPAKNVDMSFFKSFEKVKGRICFRLVSAGKNKELLERIPHVLFLDLAICFYYAYEGKELGTGTILIYNTHVELWQTSVEELMRVAQKNTPFLFPWECRTMAEALSDAEEEYLCEQDSGRESYLQEVPAEVLSNGRAVYGAVCILYPGLLRELAERRNSNFFILPCSVHETILIADTGLPEPGQLKEIVREVNATQIEPEEVLSDKIYYYDGSENQVKIIF